MTDTNDTDSDAPSGAGRTVIAMAAALVLAAVIGVAGVFWFVESERQRELAAWQIRLGIVADSRAAAVSEWLDQQFGALRELSENASLQLYMTELALFQGDRAQITDETAQAQYLENLLIAAADRTGFTAPERGPDVAANVARVGLAGLALVDATGAVLVATPGMPPLAGRLRRFVDETPKGERGLLDLHAGVADAPGIGFLAPVFAVQGGEEGSDLVGRVVGVKLVGRDFYDRLKQPGTVQQSAETVLVRASGATIDYLSPLSDGTAPLKRSLAADTPDLAAARLLAKAGGFGMFRDYKGDEVLATSRPIAGVPWSLIRKIDRAEALAETDRRLTTLLVVLLLVIGVVAVTVVAVWRHGTSVRAAQAAQRYRISSERFRNLTKFMRLVTDGQPTVITAVDESDRYTFANKQAGDQAGIAPDDMLGKTMASVLGPARAKAFEEVNRRTLQEQTRITETHVFDDDDGAAHVARSDHIPLQGDRDYPPGVLMIVDDITDLVNERARRERIMRQLVTTLVAVVDRRDPYSANHSERVAEVARAIAEEMGLEPVEAETAEIAGALMNLGKIMVPSEVLTKTDTLTEEEFQMIRDSVLHSAEMLSAVEFDGPVTTTIEQIQEQVDGGGRPRGLSADDILMAARVVAIANAFVGMTSSRAYREGMPVDEAAQRLIADTGTKYDRRPAAALLNIIDNRGGKERWAHFAAIASLVDRI